MHIFTRLTILQRLANEEYIGELYVERDFKVIYYYFCAKLNQHIHFLTVLRFELVLGHSES
jgi:hypothetical protein